jgi:hypothetical protein
MMSDPSLAGRLSLEHAIVCLVIGSPVSVLCQAVGIMGEHTPFFLMPNGLATVGAAAGFAPVSPAVADMVTKGCRKLGRKFLRTEN